MVKKCKSFYTHYDFTIKKQILQLINQRTQTYASLSRTYGIPVSTIKTWKKLNQNNKLKLPIIKGGSKQKLSQKIKSYIGRLIHQNPCLMIRQINSNINNKYNTNFSTKPIWNFLKKKYRYGNPPKKPALKREDKINRLDWANQHIDDNWRITLFCDETPFWINSNPPKMLYKKGSYTEHFTSEKRKINVFA